MDERALSILLVEDNPGDARLIEELLSDSCGTAGFRLKHAGAFSEAAAQLGNGEIDVVLLDLSLPDSQGFDTFARARDAAPETPIVVLTGMDDEQLALKAVREGAQDYLIKGDVDSALLERVLRYSIERHRIQRELRDLNANLEKRVSERTQELSEAYKALERANDDLRGLDRLKSAFIDVTSHELRTPLTAICGMLSILNSMISEEEARLRQCCQPALMAAKRLERLVVRVLEMIEKGEYGKHSRIAAVNVEQLVRDAKTEVAPFIESRRQKLSVEVEPHLPPIWVDGDKMQDVLVNLLMNAIKFTPDGGDIGVAVRRRNPDEVEFLVKDSGVGINESDRAHVFDEFFTSFETLHHSSGEYQFEKRGIGLGLAIVKKFVEMHGGTVGLETTLGEGSTFSFIIPVRAESEADSGSAQSPMSVA